MAAPVMPGMLKVLIEGARDLESLVTMGQQQPYYILECGAQRSRSRVAADGGGTDPVWHTAHKFALSNEVAMRVSIRDEVTKGVIGEAVIDLGRARATGRDDGSVALTTMGGQARGHLSYKFKFTAAEGMAPLPPAASPPPSLGGRAASEASHDGPGTGSLDGAAGGGGGSVGRGGGGFQDDPTLRSVNDKVSLAKAAMQQLQAELVEMAGGSAPGSSRGGGGGGGVGTPLSPSGSDGAAAFRGGGQHPTPPGSRAGAPPSPAHSGLSGGRPASLPDSGPGTGGQGHGRFDGGVSGGGGAGDGEPVVLEDIVAQYSRTAAEMAAAGEGGRMMSSKAMCEAIEALYSEKAAVEDELLGVKRAMAALTQQHYLDLKRARDHAHASPRATSGAGPPASPTAASSAGHSGPLRGGGGVVSLKPPRRNFEARASLSSTHSGDGIGSGGGGGGGGEGPESPVAAHRLEIQLHQQERQIAEQAAKIEAQAEEMRSLAADIATARGAGREAQARAEAAIAAAEARAAAAEARLAELEAAAAAARDEAAAARAGAESASGREAALAAELAELQAALSSAEAERKRAEAAAEAAEAGAREERAKLEADLASARDEVARLRDGAAAAGGLREQLEAARAQLDSCQGQADEVEYLQQQLRRTLRQVVELQRDVQALKQSKGGAAGAEAGPGAIASENEFLMQELVATKVELAQLKEQQLVVQRQLRQAAVRSTSGGLPPNHSGSGNFVE